MLGALKRYAVGCRGVGVGGGWRYSPGAGIES